MSTRGDRVAEQVRAAIASALLTEVQDPRLSLVSINAVKMTPDLGFARVYWAPIGAEPDPKVIRAVERALAKAGGFLRAHVARQVRLRTVPELDFVYDVAIERGRRLDSLIDGLDIPDGGDEEAP